MAAMYWMAKSCTSWGIVIFTVGLDVGTGRGGMVLVAATGLAADSLAGGAAGALGSLAAASSEGLEIDAVVPLSHPRREASAMSKKPRIIATFSYGTTRCGSRQGPSPFVARNTAPRFAQDLPANLAHRPHPRRQCVACICPDG